MTPFFQKISKRDLLEHRVSVATLLAANALPLLGVLFLGWSTFEIVLLYWFENVVLGVINVLKMLTCSPDPDKIDLSRLTAGKPEAEVQQAMQQVQGMLNNPLAMHGVKLFFVPFFTIHYGLFCLVHGMFVFALLGNGGLATGRGAPDFSLHGLSPALLIPAVGLAGSHLVSFFTNYLGRGENRRTILPVLMIQPYARIVVLHVAILFGAFAIVLLGSPVFLLVILILGKTLLDLSLHLRQHRTKEPVEGVLTTVEKPTR